MAKLTRSIRLPAGRKPVAAKPSKPAKPAEAGAPGALAALVLAAGMAVMTAGLALLLLQTDVRVPDPARIGGGAVAGLLGFAGIIVYFARWGKLTGGH